MRSSSRAAEAVKIRCHSEKGNERDHKEGMEW